MKYRLKDNEKIVHENENENTILTDRNIVKESGRFLKKKIVIKLGDIREKRLEGDRIIVTIMKGRKKKEVTFLFSKDNIKKIFDKLDELIKKCKKEGYRITTSWHWEDLVEEEYKLFIYPKKGMKIFGGFLTIFSTLLLYISVRELSVGKIQWESLLMLCAGYYLTWSYFLYLVDRIVFTGDYVVHRYFFTLKYRILDLSKMRENAYKPWVIRHSIFDAATSQCEIWVSKSSMLGLHFSISIRRKNGRFYKKFMSFPHGFYGINPVETKKYKEILKGIINKED